MKSLKALNKYILRYKKHILFGMIFIIISNVFAIFPAQVIRHSFDFVEESIYLYNIYEGLTFQKSIYDSIATSLLFYGVLVLIFAILKGVFMFFMRQTIIVMSRMIEFDLKNEIYSHYQKLDLSFYKRNNTGDLMSRISEDVSRVRMFLGPSLKYS